jgi:hypothetical protein
MEGGVSENKRGEGTRREGGREAGREEKIL